MRGPGGRYKRKQKEKEKKELEAAQELVRKREWVYAMSASEWEQERVYECKRASAREGECMSARECVYAMSARECVYAMNASEWMQEKFVWVYEREQSRAE